MLKPTPCIMMPSTCTLGPVSGSSRWPSCVGACVGAITARLVTTRRGLVVLVAFKHRVAPRHRTLPGWAESRELIDDESRQENACKGKHLLCLPTNSLVAYIRNSRDPSACQPQRNRGQKLELHSNSIPSNSPFPTHPGLPHPAEVKIARTDFLSAPKHYYISIIADCFAWSTAADGALQASTSLDWPGQ
jgi:hypothetical protein